MTEAQVTGADARSSKWMRRLMWVAGAVAVFCGGVWVAGAAYPVDHEVSVSEFVPAPVDKTWNRVVMFGAYDRWRPSVSAVSVDEDRPGHPLITETNDFGTIQYELIEHVRDERVVTRIFNNPDFGGSWVYEFEPAEGGCRVTITEHGWIESKVMRLFANAVLGLDATAKQYLADLKASFEGS